MTKVTIVMRKYLSQFIILFNKSQCIECDAEAISQCTSLHQLLPQRVTNNKMQRHWLVGKLVGQIKQHSAIFGGPFALEA